LAVNEISKSRVEAKHVLKVVLIGKIRLKVPNNRSRKLVQELAVMFVAHILEVH
jgi:hypothetical protein